MCISKYGQKTKVHIDQVLLIFLFIFFLYDFSFSISFPKQLQ